MLVVVLAVALAVVLAGLAAVLVVVLELTACIFCPRLTAASLGVVGEEIGEVSVDLAY